MTTTPPAKGIELQREAEKIAADRAELEAREAALLAAESADSDKGDEGDDAPPPWPHGTLDFAGETWEVRTPTADAAVAWNMQISKHAPEQVRNEAPMAFLSKHMSPASLERLLERFLDPDDDAVTADSIGDVLTALFTRDTTRPTEPS